MPPRVQPGGSGSPPLICKASSTRETQLYPATVTVSSTTWRGGNSRTRTGVACRDLGDRGGWRFD